MHFLSEIRMILFESHDTTRLLALAKVWPFARKNCQSAEQPNLVVRPEWKLGGSGPWYILFRT